MQATYDNKGFYCVNTAYIIPVDDKYLLGILNSKLVHFYYLKISSTIRGGYLRFIRQYLETIPIVVNKQIKPEIIKLVDQLLQLNEELQNVKLQTQRDQIQNKIDYCENRINKIVYELYGLTEEEIAIIENSIK
jgi:adenine-specific DNA-methyltransferase